MEWHASGYVRPDSGPTPEDRPRILLVIPRGEAVRNFLYSDTLPVLAAQAQVHVLSVVDSPELAARIAPYVQDQAHLDEHPPPTWVSRLRVLTENAHDRWLWSEVGKNHWELRDRRARERGHRLRRALVKATARLLARPAILRSLTRLEQSVAYRFRSTRDFDRLLEDLRPDLVFNGSHIHGQAGELPLRVAQRLGIPTAGFIFSWDNLTSRSRIFVPYGHYLVWHRPMKHQLKSIYPTIPDERIHVTGTPQFDFHRRQDLALSRSELCQRIGVDPDRPYVLWTAGIAHHFFDEHRHVELAVRLLRELDLTPRPQLVVRVNVKDVSPEMRALAAQGNPDVVFPETLWDPRSLTPRYEDLSLYSSLLRHCALGINAASTVTLELMLFGKPVINLDFDPPGSDLPWCLGYERHIRFDHYRPVAESGAVMVARSATDLKGMLQQGLTTPTAQQEAREAYLSRTFGDTLDGRSGERVASKLLDLALSSRRAAR